MNICKMKNWINDFKKRIVLMGSFQLFVATVFSQQLIFEVSPGLKWYGFSFQQTNVEITSGGSNQYAYDKIKRIGLMKTSVIPIYLA